MIKYKIVPSDVEGDIKIEKKGDVHTFTVNEMKKQKERVDKLKTEVEAQKKIEDAKMTNIATHHKEVLKMSDQTLVAATLYARAKDNSNMCKEKLDEIAKAEVDFAEDLAMIEKQTGIKIYE